MGLARKGLWPYVEITRPHLNFMGVCLATCGALTALYTTREPLPIVQCFFGTVSVFITTGGMHTLNDYFDRSRDLKIWPDRPIPSGRLRPRYALALALSLFAVGLTLVGILFNPTCFIILLITVTLGILYSKYSRDKLGYLSLAPIIGLFPVGGYAAFAGKGVFTNPVPWILYVMVMLWQAGHILVYSPAHGVRLKEEGIKTAVPAFIIVLSPRTTALLGAAFFSALLFLSLCFYFVAPLSLAYLIVALLSGSVMVSLSLKLAVNPTRENSIKAFNAASLYAMILFVAMALDVFFRFYFLDVLKILRIL